MKPDLISAEETRTLARRRMWTNWIVFALLAAFVVTVYLVSFNHVRNETNESPSSAGSQ